MSAAAEEIARDDQSGHALAEAWGIEYLKASSVSVDPRALSLLEHGDCKRLRAIPLATGAGGAVVAVCAASEERFATIRELTGEQTRFVLISEKTLDALLGSRMFADAPPAPPEKPAPAPENVAPAAETEEIDEAVDIDPGAGPTAATRQYREGNESEREPEMPEEPGAHEEPEAPAETMQAADADAAEVSDEPPPEADRATPTPEVSVDNIVGAVLSALKHRVGSTPEHPAAAAVETDAEAAQLPTSTAELLAHLDATVETWSSLRATLADIHAEFEETKRALRETKEQLSVAHADNDQYRKRVRMLEGELAESRDLVTQARARLQEAAGLLQTDPTQLEEPAELL